MPKRKQKFKSSKIPILASGLASFAFLVVIAVFSFQMAALSLALMAITAALVWEHQKRGHWEIAAGFEIKNLKTKQDQMQKDLAMQKYILEDIKEELKIKRTPEPITPIKHVPTSIKQPPSVRTPVKRKDPPLSSRAVNDDPFADTDSLSDMVVRELIQDAVKNNRIDVFAQPIMRLPQRMPHYYEVFARIRARAGLYLPAARYMKLAQEDKLINRIDDLLLMQCLKSIELTAFKKEALPFFINITASTLSNKQFMSQLLMFLSKKRELAAQLVFEMKQKEFENISPAILEILRGLGRLGCSMSIDHVESMNFDVKFLQILRVKFVKINALALFKHTVNEKSFAEMMRFKKQIEGNGIRFIVEKIEDEKTLREILDFDIHYGQGYLFARPMPDLVLKRTA